MDNHIDKNNSEYKIIDTLVAPSMGTYVSAVLAAPASNLLKNNFIQKGNCGVIASGILDNFAINYSTIITGYPSFNQINTTSMFGGNIATNKFIGNNNVMNEIFNNSGTITDGIVKKYNQTFINLQTVFGIIDRDSSNGAIGFYPQKVNYYANDFYGDDCKGTYAFSYTPTSGQIEWLSKSDFINLPNENGIATNSFIFDNSSIASLTTSDLMNFLGTSINNNTSIGIEGKQCEEETSLMEEKKIFWANDCICNNYCVNLDKYFTSVTPGEIKRQGLGDINDIRPVQYAKECDGYVITSGTHELLWGAFLKPRKVIFILQQTQVEKIRENGREKFLDDFFQIVNKKIILLKKIINKT